MTVNAPPQAEDDLAQTRFDTPVTIDVLDNDDDSDGTIDPTTVSIVDEPAHGSVDVDPDTGEITYTPNAGFSGDDTFTYTVADTDGGVSEPATVTVHVNAPPTAADDTAQTQPDQALVIDVLDNDTDADGQIDPTTVQIVSPPSHGQVDVDPVTGQITYTPDPGYEGDDAFTYTVNDDSGDTSNVAAVNVAVAPLVVTIDNVTVKSVVFTDSDGTQVTVTIKPGTAAIGFAGQNLVMINNKGVVTVTGDNVALSTIALTGTTAATSLTINGKGGDGVTSVQTITVDGDLKAITGKVLDLTGSLIVDGKLGALTLHDVTDAQVQINGADAKAALTITLNNADGMTLASEVQIKKLTATSVTGDSVIAAPALASGTVKGDFIADLTIGGVVGLSTPLGTIKITGRVKGDWILAQGGAKAVTVGSSQGWTFVAAGQIASITSNGDMIGGSVQADTIGKLTSKGEFRILVEALGQDAKGQSLGTLTVGRATDATLNVAGGVKSIKAVEWLDGGIAAGWIGSLTVSGNKAASIAGDFEIDLTLTDVAVAKTLGTFKAAGSILDGQWDIAGVVGSITALATCDGWTLVAQTVGTIKLTGELRGQIAVGGQDAKGQSLGTLQAGSVPDATLDAAGGVKTIKVVEWLDGEIKAGWINALAVSGNKKTNVAGDLAVDVTLTDASVAKTLSKLTVAGTLLQARIFSAGVVGSVTLGAMDRSQLLVGTSDGVEGPVESPDDFDLQTVKPSLASFTIKGLASAPDQPSMIGSWVTAWNIGKATVKFVAAAAPDEPFGFAAGFVGSLAFLADGVNSNKPITLKQLDTDADLLDVKKNPTGVVLPVDEFIVVLV